jgi:hypothetical protein
MQKAKRPPCDPREALVPHMRKACNDSIIVR